MAEAGSSTLLPAKDDLLRGFREYENGIAYDNARRAAVIAALFMLAGWSLDLIILADHAVRFLIIRAVCALLLGGIFWHLGKAGGFVRAKVWPRASRCCPIISICIMIAMTEGGNSTYYAGLNLVLVGLSLLLRWNFWNSLGMILACFRLLCAQRLDLTGKTGVPHVVRQRLFPLRHLGICHCGQLLLRTPALPRVLPARRGRALAPVARIPEQAAQRADEAKTRFFANISHELRTPLTIMLGITERLKIILARQPVEPVIGEMTAMLEQNGLRLLKLIDDLLDLVRFDTGHGDVKRLPTPIAAHFDGLLRSLRHLAEQDRVALFWDCESDRDNIRLDRDKFDKILLNLVINAIKFTPSGGTIEVKRPGR